MNDPISDMFARIRNASMAGHTDAVVPYSRIKETLIQILNKHNYIAGYEINEEGQFKDIIVTINEPGSPVNFDLLERVSKPGRRVYAKTGEIPYIRSGMGDVIISTSQGLMVGKEARKRRLGGEVICKVY